MYLGKTSSQKTLFFVYIYLLQQVALIATRWFEVYFFYSRAEIEHWYLRNSYNLELMMEYKLNTTIVLF